MSLLHVIVFLFIGFLVFTIDKKQENFPVPVALLLVGFGLSFFTFFSDIRPTHELIHDWFLPAVLFTAAYQFDTTWLKKNAGIIVLISTVGLLSAIFLLGSSIYLLGLASLSFAGALVVATILVPSDSVSVIAIQQESQRDKKVEEIAEGESLASDGMSTVVFATVSAMFLMDEPFRVGTFLLDFLVKAGGGLVIGAALGFLFSRVLHLIRHHQYQVMLSIILAYSSFYLTESFHMAGLLATISAGLFLSRAMERSRHEEDYRSYLNGFWEVVEPAILSILFLLIGTEFLSFFHWEHSWAVVLAFLLMLLCRFGIVWAASSILPRYRKQLKFSEKLLVTFSGIKGSVSVALLLSLATSAETDAADAVLSLTFGVIFLSILIQSLLIHPISKRIADSD